jgi:membrane-bound lytic murein transglycosylase MltF
MTRRWAVPLALLLAVAEGRALEAAPPPKTAPAARPSPKPFAIPIAVQPWKGDLDGMVKRRRIRVLVVFSKTQYFVDRGAQYGTAYEIARAFEDYVNVKRKTNHLKVAVVCIPVSRGDLVPALLEGRGDMAMAGLTITPERLQQVAFSVPFWKGISEIAVTGPSSPKVSAVDDLSGQEVFVRRSSSYWSHLEELNQRFAKEGKTAVRLRPAPEELEDEDLLEMLSAGLVKLVVVDDYKAQLWAKVFPRITPQAGAAVHTGSEVAAMLRKDSPLLEKELAAFVKTHGQGTTFGNTVARKYTGSTRFVKPATSASEVAKYERTVELFQRYGERYGLDYLLMMAQGYQESRLDQTVKSPVGAIGVMQVMPATAKELAVGNVSQLDANIHAGVKYIRFMIDRYYADEPMDDVNKALFAFASYNAGPARVRQLRQEAAAKGLDPNLWFHNVDTIAAARIGAETVTYVSNIYKYYVAYRLLSEDAADRKKAKDAVRTGGQ